VLGGNLAEQATQPLTDRRFQHGPAVLRAPHEVVLEREHRPLVLRVPAHPITIQPSDIYCTGGRWTADSAVTRRRQTRGGSQWTHAHQRLATSRWSRRSRTPSTSRPARTSSPRPRRSPPGSPSADCWTPTRVRD